MKKYNDTLDPAAQVDMEESIAAAIFDRLHCSEEKAQELGRRILQLVLVEFRPDFFGKPKGKK